MSLQHSVTFVTADACHVRSVYRRAALSEENTFILRPLGCRRSLLLGSSPFLIYIDRYKPATKITTKTILGGERQINYLERRYAPDNRLEKTLNRTFLRGRKERTRTSDENNILYRLVDYVTRFSLLRSITEVKCVSLTGLSQSSQSHDVVICGQL